MSRIAGLLVLLDLLLLAPPHAVQGGETGDQPPRIQLCATVSDKETIGAPRLCVSNLDAAQLDSFAARNPALSEWQSIWAVYLVPESGVIPADQPPLSGTYRVVDHTLVFALRYPPTHTRVLRARLDTRPLGGARQFESDFKLDGLAKGTLRGSPATQSQVNRVHPSGDVLPENLLRFYIQFSAPMSRGEAYRHIRLLDSSGRAVPDPFLELDEELWSPRGDRFTLLFDPGRIKRGLKPREEVGPILVEGHSYTLEIDSGWSDAQGNPLKGVFRKSFRAGAPDSTPPDPTQWKLNSPPAASMEALEARFAEPLDHALAQRLISVVDAPGKPLAGVIDLDETQTRWRFVPRSLWKAGEKYRLVIGTDLEDLAGNGIGRPFEVDMTGPITSRISSTTVSLPFQVGPAAR